MLQSLFIPWFTINSWSLPIPFIGDIAIQPFGILVAIGIVLASLLAEKRTLACGIPQKVIADLIVHVVPLSLISAYFLNAVFYHPNLVIDILHDPKLLLENYLGLSSFGGFLGGIIGGMIWRYRRKMSLIVVGDAIGFAFPLGWLFGRTGCFLIHDHPGIITDFPLAVDNYRMSGLARHDLGLYEAIFSLMVMVLFLFLARKKRPQGFFLSLLPLLYSPIRFFLDFLRETPQWGGDARYLGFTPAQYGSILLFIIGLGLFYRVVRGPKLNLELS